MATTTGNLLTRQTSTAQRAGSSRVTASDVSGGRGAELATFRRIAEGTGIYPAGITLLGGSESGRPPVEPAPRPRPAPRPPGAESNEGGKRQ